MSASLIVLIPILLVGLVGALCFVGCGFPTSGEAADLGPYENAINKLSNLVAFWPLLEGGPPNGTAADVAPKPLNIQFNGKYIGNISQQQPGIVPGDVQETVTVACTAFNGGTGSVQVMFHPELNPAPPFTLECWVQPNWPASDMNIHAVVVTTDLNAATGYALFCDNNNFWGAVVGFGPTTQFMQTTPAATSQAVVPGMNTVFYLAMTFDGAVLNVFVTPIGTPFNLAPYAQAMVQMPMPPASPPVFAPSVSPLPLFIGLGRPDMPPGQLPFIGQIQDVAFYNKLLSPTELMNNFNLGSNPPAGG